jgi:4-hydroxybenzoate polyprenyltransferase
MKFLLSRSAFLHLRFPFSLFLMPVYIFALSQAPFINTYNSVIAFIIWHFFVYPASNGYNSYFDKDEDSIALLKHPPKVDKSLYNISLLLEFLGILMALNISLEFTAAVIIYGILSKLYSHPAVRLKKYPVISFFVVFLFQGAFVYWTSYMAISGTNLSSQWNYNFILAGLVCSCLIGASYPLTQVYQHEEDGKRGDKTLSILLGIKGSFWFSAALFITGALLLFIYWANLDQIINFYIFIAFCIPVLIVFINWFIKVYKNSRKADFQNMSRMMFTSSIAMLLYFLFIWFGNSTN